MSGDQLIPLLHSLCLGLLKWFMQGRDHPHCVAAVHSWMDDNFLLLDQNMSSKGMGPIVTKPDPNGFFFFWGHIKATAHEVKIQEM